MGTIEVPGLLESWAEGQPTVVWRQPIGTGYSAVTAVGDRLYTMDADENQEHVLCLDAATGKTLWKVDAGEFVQAELGDGGPRSTPTVVDGVVYTTTSQALLQALDAEDGKLIWKKDLTEMGPSPRFGYAASALVDGETVILEVGRQGQEPRNRGLGQRRPAKSRGRAWKDQLGTRPPSWPRSEECGNMWPFVGPVRKLLGSPPAARFFGAFRRRMLWPPSSCPSSCRRIGSSSPRPMTALVDT